MSTEIQWTEEGRDSYSATVAGQTFTVYRRHPAMLWNVAIDGKPTYMESTLLAAQAIVTRCVEDGRQS